MQKLLVIFLLLLSNNLFSQNPFQEDLSFLLQKIQHVYAGYKDKVNEKEFNQIIDQIKKSSSKDTLALLSKLTNYFKDYHLSLYRKLILNAVDSIESNKNLIKINEYIERNAKHFDNYEGYWMDEDDGIVIFLKKISKNQYNGYIVETVKRAPLGLCILKMNTESKHAFSSDYTSLTWSVARIFAKSFLKNDKILIVGSYAKFKKLNDYKDGMLNLKRQFSYKPEIKILDSNSVLIRMPDFSGNNAKLYDSIITANESYISRSKNLIIDIRNNGGGTSRCYKPLFPFICTGPIIVGGGHQLCSDDIIDDAKSDLERYIKINDTSNIKEYKDYIGKMEKNKYNFLFWESDTVACQPKPNQIRNVAIIMNHGSRSAAELLVLNFKQSNKVRTFGEPTAGAVDYLDMLTYKLPKTQYNLWVGTVRRKLTKTDGKYDDTGIKPDIEISDDEADWVKFVQQYYKNQ